MIITYKTVLCVNECSVGSLGINGAFETVEEVHVRNCTFTQSQNGARIKTRAVMKC